MCVSSANYVEQQQPGVFPKTLRNMWVAVTFINPLTGFLAQCLMTVPAIAAQVSACDSTPSLPSQLA